jgi:hypothetical protein
MYFLIQREQWEKKCVQEDKQVFKTLLRYVFESNRIW